MTRWKRVGAVIFLASLAAELIVAKQRGVRFGRNTVVRCRAGHLFATIWIPGGSFKALRFGWWRIQFCPVGRHWALVAPVGVSELSEAEHAAAIEHHDIRIP